MQKKTPCREATPFGGELQKRIVSERGIGEWCIRDRFKRIYTMAYRSNVPLQVFSRETTPILSIESPPITEGLHSPLCFGGGLINIGF